MDVAEEQKKVNENTHEAEAINISPEGVTLADTSTDDLYLYDEEFRDSIATVDESGKRIWVYPKKPKGRYHNARIVVTIVLLAIFFAGPFIRINGHHFLMLNIFDRKFEILGTVFWPQDFFIFAIGAITFFVFITLFTVAFGRLWCGWACPQTLFMEMVFRKIEYWIEGDANQQRKLDKAPWNKEKILKKSAKQLIYVAISILISHTAMAYLIGTEQVREIVSQPPTEHMAGFLGLTFFTGVFYWVFARFREQACVAVCPYGRLQGVLLVKDSIAVMYDWLRGEPRGRVKKNEERTDKGDCIDCKLCVHACPTGIDIRNGTQLECVNCTACIDACDEVMLKVGKPKGLIRYSSYNAIKEGTKKLFNPRVAGYSVVLIALISLLSFMLATRSDIDARILKVPGTLYQRDGDKISNLYNISFTNKRPDDVSLSVRLLNMPDGVISQATGQAEVSVPAEDIYEGIFFIKIPKDQLTSTNTGLRIGIYMNDELVEEISAKFLGPVSIKK
ncbi:MAG: cytochrome c oxidase accessory protein CcoG [Bacteroidota bacterium]